jgi:hypothetical protein
MIFVPLAAYISMMTVVDVLSNFWVGELVKSPACLAFWFQKAMLTPFAIGFPPTPV